MGKKKFAKSPLLYIQQPSIQQPEAPMQHHYTTPKKLQTDVKQTTSTQEKPVKPMKKRHHSFNDQPTQTQEKVNESKNKGEDLADNKEKNNEGERPKFRDMSLEEKIEYFVSLPAHIPKMRCEVRTKDRNYRGTIDDRDEDAIFMRVGRRTSPTKINMEDIEEIRLLGF